MSKLESIIPEKWKNLAFITIAQTMIMGLWFSASAVIPQLKNSWDLDSQLASWLTISVQIGFVLGAVFCAILNLNDLFSNRYIISLCTAIGAIVTASIAFFDFEFYVVIIFRIITGFVMAGIYPPAMKIAASWCLKDRGLAVGFLVGANTLGAALPHLLNAVPVLGECGMPPWPDVLFASAIIALVGAVIVFYFVKEGPYVTQSAPLNWRFAFKFLSYRPTRLANFGYLGHMWELYAVWAWMPIFIIESYKSAGLPIESARLASFFAIGSGFAGCILAGFLADRFGRTIITICCLTISGMCCLLAGLFFNTPSLLVIICIIWGFFAVADSAQFSAAITELTDKRYVGTALTVQTSLGFLLTIITIYGIPYLFDSLGWQWGFMVLAIGPVFGIVSMFKLRRLPEAKNMATGKR